MKKVDQVDRCLKFLTGRAESAEEDLFEDLSQATAWTLKNTREAYDSGWRSRGSRCVHSVLPSRLLA